MPGGDAVVYVEVKGKIRPANIRSHQQSRGHRRRHLAVSWQGGTPRKIDAGDYAANLLAGRIAYAKGNQVWLAGPNAETSPSNLCPRQDEPLGWSPDGRACSFLFARRITVLSASMTRMGRALKFVAPSVDSDSTPSGRATANILPLYDALRFSGTLPMVFSLNRIARNPGPFGWPMPTRPRARTLAQQLHSPKARTPIWLRTLAAEF